MRQDNGKTMNRPSNHQCAPMRGAGFTLIELLVVIAIIGILISLVVGAVQSVVRSRKIAQAQSEVQAIAVATEEYRRLFREIPLATNWYDPRGSGGPYGNDCWYVSGMAPDALAAEFYNRLLGSNETQVVLLKIERIEGVNSTNGVLRDPWGTPYDFYLDSNYDGRIDLDPYRPSGWFIRIQQDITIFVRSRGPDRNAGARPPSMSDDVTWPPFETIRWLGW